MLTRRRFLAGAGAAIGGAAVVTAAGPVVTATAIASPLSATEDFDAEEARLAGRLGRGVRRHAEVYDTANNLSAEQEAIARFWSGDPGATVTRPATRAPSPTRCSGSRTSR